MRSGSIAFLVLAGLQALIGFFLLPAILIDAAILAVLALIIMKAHSRVVALILLLVAGAEAVVTLLNRIGVMSEGGRNIFLAAIMLILAVRMVEATFQAQRQIPDCGPATAAPGSRAGHESARRLDSHSIATTVLRRPAARACSSAGRRALLSSGLRYGGSFRPGMCWPF